MVETLDTRCCIVGGGPAGMMLALLLARAGIDVVVLEKHGDFLRDFRGDTIHPSTLEVITELGLLDAFLQRPHQKVSELHGSVDGFDFQLADFSHLPTRCRFIAFMPQWDFLDFLVEQGRRYPGFEVRMRAEVTDVIEAGGRMSGVRARTSAGVLEVRAALTVAADGRGSGVRARAGLTVRDFGAPIDVLWMRLPRRPDDPRVVIGRIRNGRILVQLYRGEYWQCGYVIPKGEADALRRRGIESFREELAATAPYLADRVHEIRDWDDVKLLTVRVDRLERWYRPGLLCIGDAAHAMSPVGGVGINLAIQDAVAAANRLVEPLRAGVVTDDDLRSVQRRREWPTRWTQRLQLFLQDRIIGRALGASGPIRPPWPFRLLARWPVLRRIPAYVVGVGFRPEHVRTPEAAPTPTTPDSRDPVAPSER